jgi:hypothetical protein
MILWRLIIEGLGANRDGPHMSNHLDDARLDELLALFGSSSEIASTDPNAFRRAGNLIAKASSYRSAIDVFPSSAPASHIPKARS